LFTHPEDSRDRQRMAIALAKGAAMLQKRRVDLAKPATWEFSAFSQNGEDGVLDVLLGQLAGGTRTCVEIGSGDGVENNTTWLLVAEKYCGLMVEGDRHLARRTQRNVIGLSIGSQCLNQFVTRDDMPALLEPVPSRQPDVFSLDIDGNDFHIMAALLDAGFRPKIIVVEYNSVFGRERSLTIPYQGDFCLDRSHPSQLAYGVSIAAWRKSLSGRGYRFVTVERNGVNAFFVDPAHFQAGFLDGVDGLEFAENRYQLRKFGMASDLQFKLIEGETFLEV
jgi:hypothetical protein